MKTFPEEQIELLKKILHELRKITSYYASEYEWIHQEKYKDKWLKDEKAT